MRNSAMFILAIGLPVALFAGQHSATPEAILTEALASRNPDTRKEAVAALGIAASRGSYLAKLIGMLEDKDMAVRLATVASLSESRSPRAMTALRKALDDKAPEVSFAAAKSLWALRDPAGKRALMAVVQGENKASSAFLTKQKRDTLRMMQTPRTALLFAAQTGASFVPLPGLGSGIALMKATLIDPAISERAAAALLLGQQSDPRTIEVLRGALTDRDASLRAAAVHVLALRNRVSATADIEPLLSDEKEVVRLRAAAALIRLSAIAGSRSKASTGTAALPAGSFVTRN